jgi:hypothetical protein
MNKSHGLSASLKSIYLAQGKESESVLGQSKMSERCWHKLVPSFLRCLYCSVVAGSEVNHGAGNFLDARTPVLGEKTHRGLVDGREMPHVALLN